MEGMVVRRCRRFRGWSQSLRLRTLTPREASFDQSFGEAEKLGGRKRGRL